MSLLWEGLKIEICEGMFESCVDEDWKLRLMDGERRVEAEEKSSRTNLWKVEVCGFLRHHMSRR